MIMRIMIRRQRQIRWTIRRRSGIPRRMTMRRRGKRIRRRRIRRRRRGIISRIINTSKKDHKDKDE